MNANVLESLECRRLLAANLVPGATGIYPADAVSLNNVSYFAADYGAHGKELWRSDATPAGTSMVRDVVPGATGSDATNLTIVGGAILFVTHNPDGSSSGIWKSDGTEAGTVELKAFDANTLTRQVAVIGGRLLFPTYNTDTGSADLWVSNGTADGTKIISHLFTGTERAVPDMLDLGNGRVLLQDSGQLFSSDGTSGGMIELGDLSGADTTRPKFARTPSRSGEVTLFLAERGEGQELEVWGTDGTAYGTQRIATAGVGAAPGTFTAVGTTDFGRIPALSLFQTVQGTEHKLWITDGSKIGTRLVFTSTANIEQAISLHTNFGFYDTKGLLLFHDAAGQYQLGMFEADDSSVTTLKTLMTKGTLSAPPVVINDIAFFIVSDADDVDSPARSTQLWRSNGTADGTVLVRDLTDTQIKWSATTLSNVDEKLVVTTKTDAVVIDPRTLVAGGGYNRPRCELDTDHVLRVFGTSGDDSIRIYRKQNDADHFIVSLNGVKSIFAFADVRKALIYGREGNDGIAYVEKNGLITLRTVIQGGQGNDTIHGNSTRDTIWAEAGDDLIKSGRSADWVDGGLGDDTIYGSTGDDTLIGQAGADRLFGQRDDDLVSGGDDQSDNHLDAGSGADLIFAKTALEVFFNGKQTTDGDDPLDEVLLS